MLPDDTVRLVERLLALGHSRRAVAFKAGISRAAVDGIASGEWRAKAEQKAAKRAQSAQDRSEPLVVARCPECGARAEILDTGACRGCTVLAQLRNRLRAVGGDSPIDDDPQPGPDPSPAAIAELRKDIRRSWSPAERRRRWRLAHARDGEPAARPERLTIPVINTAGLFADALEAAG